MVLVCILYNSECSCKCYQSIFVPLTDIQEPREKKPRWDQPKDVIKVLLQAREKFHEQSTGISGKRKNTEE